MLGVDVFTIFIGPSKKEILGLIIKIKYYILFTFHFQNNYSILNFENETGFLV